MSKAIGTVLEQPQHAFGIRGIVDLVWDSERDCFRMRVYHGEDGDKVLTVYIDRDEAKGLLVGAIADL